MNGPTVTAAPLSRPCYPVRRAQACGCGIHWGTAEVLRDFRFPWEKRTAPRTEFRAIWDDERLLFRFDCDDEDLVLAPGADAREKVIGSDRAEIFFARDFALDPYYAVEIDPRGEVLAYEGRFYRRMNWDWSFPGLKACAVIATGGYVVEGTVPLSTLRELGVLRSGETTLLAGVFRAEFSRETNGIRQGWMSWVDPGTEKPDFHVPEAFGVFQLEG
jgi:hypothetical protein